jgi:hypothetical protein
MIFIWNLTQVDGLRNGNRLNQTQIPRGWAITAQI